MTFDRAALGIIAACLIAALVVTFAPRVEAAQSAEPETCSHVATAATIEVYYCDDLDLFVNQLGFMVFEP